MKYRLTITKKYLVPFFLPLVCSAQTVVDVTTINAAPLDELGYSKTIKPVEQYNYSNSASHSSADLSQSLNYFSGLQNRQNGSPLVSIRGSQSSSRVLVLQEGIPLNFADGVGYNSLFIPREDLDSVFVLKGPATSTFGRDALSGAINFKTQQTPGTRFFTSYGSFGLSEVFAGYGSSKLFLTAYQDHNNGFRDRNNSETVRSSAKYIDQFNLGENTFLKLRSYNLMARQIGTTPGPITSPAPSNYNNAGHIHSLFLNLNDFLISQTSFALLEQNYDGSYSKSQALRQNTKIKKIFSSFELEFFNELSFEKFLANYLGAGEKYFSQNEFGANLSFSYDPTTDVILSTRYELTSSQLISSLGCSTYKNGWNYFFSYSQGYTPVSLTQKYSQTSYFVGNPALNPERSDEVDLGFIKTWAPFDVQFEFFYRTMSELIENRTVGAVLVPQNVGKAEAQGFELMSKYDGGHYLLNAHIDYLKNINTVTNDPITLSPTLQAGFGAEKTLGTFLTALNVTYWSNYYDRTTALISMPSWIVFDITFTKKITPQLSLLASVFNITDEPRQLTFGYPEPQRSFKVQLRGQF